MFAMVDVLYLCAGGAIVWVSKDALIKWGQNIVAWYHNAESYAAVLEAKAKTLQAKADAIKAAVKS